MLDWTGHYPEESFDTTPCLPRSAGQNISLARGLQSAVRESSRQGKVVTSAASNTIPAPMSRAHWSFMAWSSGRGQCSFSYCTSGQSSLCSLLLASGQRVKWRCSGRLTTIHVHDSNTCKSLLLNFPL
jgi:hypothetical protein